MEDNSLIREYTDPAVYDSNLDLLLGLYTYSLIATPPRTRSYNYLPTWEDVFYETRYNNALLDYEYELKRIHDMETWKMKSDAQRIIDDLESDLKRAKERAKEED